MFHWDNRLILGLVVLSIIIKKQFLYTFWTTFPFVGLLDFLKRKIGTETKNLLHFENVGTVGTI